MMEQSESDDIFVFKEKAKELMITGSSMLLSCSNGKIEMWIFSPWVP